MALVAALWLAACFEVPSAEPPGTIPSPAPITPAPARAANEGAAVAKSEAPDDARLRTGRERLHGAFRERESRVWIEADGHVSRNLRDDLDGDRHQRFLLDVDGVSVLVAHNIDLAERVPVRQGDRVVFRGRYEHNDKGGVIHWTHHDPQGRGPGGWITHRGKTYR